MSKKFGLSKGARLAAEREKEKKENATPPLDLSFPYKMEPFDPSFFALPANPAPIEEKSSS